MCCPAVRKGHSHARRARREAVGRLRAGRLPGSLRRREGYFEGRGYQVTWALGHLATLKEPQDYDAALKKWSLESLPIVPERFGVKLIEEGGSRKQFGVIRRLFRDADELICATDAGREGELIFRYILELAGCVGKPSKRLWLSSLTESAIRDAFARLRPLADYDALYDAARCRSEADWLIGLNATRFHTVKHRASGILWSVGRVQTPVLALIVRRDDEIRTFRSEPFWELTTHYRKVLFKFAGDRFAQEEDAQVLLSKVAGHPFVIKGVDRKAERLSPPLLHDLTDLQREMNRRFGMSADATLKSAQSLYESKLITYPRTDSRHLTRDMKGKLPGILEQLRAYKPSEIGRLDLANLPFSGRIIDDVKVSDHHAIIPTGKKVATPSPAHQRVYDAIVVRLIAAFYPACVKEATTVDGASEGVPFRARGVRVVDPGWTILESHKDEKKDDAQDLPDFRPGESGPHAPAVRRGETTPPKPYTEGTLLGAMETAGKLVDDEALKEALKERGLGTPATRASIIETLLTRGYISREGKTLAATDAGRYLIAIVRDRGLKSAELTGDWEARLRAIERGQLDPETFMAEIGRYTADVVRAVDPPIDPTRLGDCPRCGRPVVEGKKGFGCSGWKEGCPFVVWRECGGQILTDDQIRQLLQRRILPKPGAPTEVILQLLDNGLVSEIPVPTGPSRKQSGKISRPAAGGGKRWGGRRASTAPPAEAAPNTVAIAYGACPLCKSPVVEGAKSYGCSGWRDGCKFAIWKTIAGKKITPKTAQALLSKGRSQPLKGFASKSGETFDARLKLEGGEVRFDFGKG